MLAFLALGAGIAQAATYTYDANGRLKAVTKSTGDSAEYIYDALGNLLRVDSVPAGQLKIFAFSPSHGMAGAQVTVSGQGFSTTAANDALSFNGTAATVTSATATTLITNVPVGASTGKIGITVGSQSALSDDDFVVDTTGQPPTITSVTPLVGAIGTNVTVSGQNLYPVANKTLPAINGWKTTPSSASDTEVQFAVPAKAGSGKVSITTPYGVATSTTDFTVPPAGILAANVALTDRIAVGSGTSLTIPAGQYGAVLFDAAGKSWLSIQFSGITSSASTITYSIYDPQNHRIKSGTLTPSSRSIHLPQLGPMSGTYSIWISPNTASASINLAIETDPTISPSDSGANVSTSYAGQTKRVIFTASPGANIGYGMTAFTETHGNASFIVYDHLNADVGQSGCNTSPAAGCGLDLQNLKGGNYQVIVTPEYATDTMSFTALVSNDMSAALAPDVPVSGNLTRRGQTATYTFTANAGQVFAFQATGGTTAPSGQVTWYYIYNPSGALAVNGYSTGYKILNTGVLSQSGAYKVYVQPDYGSLLTEQVTLVSGVVGTLAVDGSPQNFSTSAGGQNVYMYFTASPGDSLGLGVSGFYESSGQPTIYVYDANNTLVADDGECANSRGGCALDLKNLAGGTYKVVVVPTNNGTMSFAATLSHDITATLSPDTPISGNITRRGQTATYTFNATAGQTFAFQATGGSTVPSGNETYYYVYKPNGSLLVSGYSTGYKLINLLNLPTTGTYSIYVQPDYGSTLTEQVALISGVTGSVTVNGDSQSFATTIPGQTIYIYFTASAGDNVGLGISGFNESSGQPTVYVYDASNTLVADDGECSNARDGCALDLKNLAGGNYRVSVVPAGNSTMSFTVTLSHDITGILTPDTPISGNIARRGQTATYTFNATAGQTFAFQATGGSTLPSGNDTYYYIYKPNGSLLVSGYSTGYELMNLLNLPTTGTYSIYVQPQYGATVTEQVTLVSGVTGTLAIDGAPQNFSTSAPEQHVYLYFTPAAGDSLNLTFSNFSTSTSGYATITVYNASGSSIATKTCYTSSGGCTIGLPSLSNQTYEVVVTPNGYATVGFTVGLTHQ